MNICKKTEYKIYFEEFLQKDRKDYNFTVNKELSISFNELPMKLLEYY